MRTLIITIIIVLLLFFLNPLHNLFLSNQVQTIKITNARVLQYEPQNELITVRGGNCGGSVWWSRSRVSSCTSV